jgi:hypothetical protein
MAIIESLYKFQKKEMGNDKGKKSIHGKNGKDKAKSFPKPMGFNGNKGNSPKGTKNDQPK